MNLQQKKQYDTLAEKVLNIYWGATGERPDIDGIATLTLDEADRVQSALYDLCSRSKYETAEDFDMQFCNQFNAGLGNLEEVINWLFKNDIR